jgi:hypothetical protein
MERSGLLEAIGPENVFGDIDAALARARGILSPPAAPRPPTVLQ